MKKIELWTIALQINYMWYRIIKNRNVMEKIIENEGRYTSEKLIALDAQNIHFGDQAYALRKRYFMQSST